MAAVAVEMPAAPPAAPDAVAADSKPAKPKKKKTAFAQRNPHLEKLVPDVLEGLVDAILPDALEARMDNATHAVAVKYQDFKTDFNEGFGEIAGVLFRVAKYAATRFNIGDLVFGVYHLADHHNKNNEVDRVEGTPVTDPTLVKWLLYCTDMAVMSYCPTKEQLCAAVEIPPEDVVIFQPKADTNRPAYAVCVDHHSKNVIWGFRGTTDLADMLTDVCAACTPYCGGYAHWGMLSATEWFVRNELANVRAVCDAHPGYGLVLVGHSLGAGTACLLAHWIKNVPEAGEVMRGVDVRAVGVATPAVLTAELAQSCSDYVSSIVLMHDVVPRFSIHNVFEMKHEMDATNWGDVLAETIKDWMVPDVIEKSETYQRLTHKVTHHCDKALKCCINGVARAALTVASVAARGFKACGCGRKSKTKHAKEEEEEAEAAAAAAEADATEGTFADRARAMAAARGRASAEYNDATGLVAEAAYGQMSKFAEEDVAQVFAPGRLYFLYRHDKPEPSDSSSTAGDAAAAPGEGGGEGGGATDAEQIVWVNEAGEEGAPEGAAPPGRRSRLAEHEAAAVAAAQHVVDRMRKNAAERRRARRRARRQKEEAKERKKLQRLAKAGDKEAIAALAIPYPGATFELVEGSTGQRFERIVLRQTCLSDHLCNGYLQGLEYALKHAQTVSGEEGDAPSDVAAAKAAAAAAKGKAKGGKEAKPADKKAGKPSK